jgi:hypothetical protein
MNKETNKSVRKTKRRRHSIISISNVTYCGSNEHEKEETKRDHIETQLGKQNLLLRRQHTKDLRWIEFVGVPLESVQR